VVVVVVVVVVMVFFGRQMSAGCALRDFVGGGRGDSGVEEKRGERGRTVRAAWDALLGA